MSSAVASGSSHRLSDEATAAANSVHSALSPRIAVLSSPDVQAALDANHFTDFSDLLKPFESSIENLNVRTSQLETRRCETFPLSFDCLDAFAPASASASTSTLFTPADIVTEQSTIADIPLPSRKRSARYSRPELLLDAISARVSIKSKAVWENRELSSSSRRHSRRISSLGGNEGSLKGFVDVDNDADLERYRKSSIDDLTPWFADTKSMVLNTRHVSEHETFGHPLAILLVVSTDSSDPMNAFASLFEASQATSCKAFKLRPYVDPLILRYYVFLHDVSKSGTDLSESIALLENVKKTYGLHCCLLPINSAAEGGMPSAEISALYRKAFRSDRRSAKGSEGEETTPPKVPPKEGHHDPTLIEIEQSVEDEEKEKWYTEKEEDVTFGEALNEDDVKKIKSFVRDFAAQSLIPFLERCVSLWNEQLAASRKGLTGRLFGAASRKLFSGTTGRGAQTVTANSFAALGYYPHASMEAQTRRLADFAFVTRDYKLAAAMYDQGRRDYANDKAAKYIAGANEMFGLSHLMIMLIGHSAPIDVDSYLAAAGFHYLNSPRQKGSALQLDSLRATLLYYEIYRGLQFYRSAPFALVRTATEGAGDAENDLEVAGAMLLEQAAICDLRHSDRPALRKCALHLVMAAHRYRSCGQKHLSFRCFQGAASFYRMLKEQKVSQEKQSRNTDEDEEQGRERLSEYLAIYETKQTSQWDLIEDHMEQELGQQASSEGQAEQAVLHFYTLLHRQKQSVSGSLEENAKKHEEYLQGFLNCCKYLETDLTTLLQAHKLEASLPLVDSNSSLIQVNSRDRHLDDQWFILEEEALVNGGKHQGKLKDTVRVAAVDEVFWVNLALVNPLSTPLNITSLSVVLQDENGEVVGDDLATIQVIDEVDFYPLEEKKISISITVNQPCKLRCSSVHYLLAGQIAFQEPLHKRGKRLNDTKLHRSALEPQYAPSEDLSVVIQLAKPYLEATVKEEIVKLGLGEEVAATIVVENKGKVPLKHARVIVSRPDAIIDRSSALEMISGEEMKVSNNLRTSKAMIVPLPDETLDSGKSIEWPVLMRGSALGILTLRLLFIYESEQGEVLTSQLQHTIQVEAVIDLAVQAGPTRTEDFAYNLKIESINLIGTEEEEENVTITALSFVSPAWKNVEVGKDLLQSFSSMTHLDKQNTDTTLQYHPSSLAIKDMSYTVGQLQNILTGRNTSKEMFPPPSTVNTSHLNSNSSSSSHTISPFLLLARREYRISTLLSQFATSINSTREIEQIFPLYEPNEVDVIAHWRLDKSNRKGQAFVFGLNLGPLHDYFENLFMKKDSNDKLTRSLYAETEKEKAALWLDLTKNRLHIEEDPILFDFVTMNDSKTSSNQTKLMSSAKVGSRSIIDVEFFIRNLSTSRSRDVMLQLDNTLAPATSLASMMTSKIIQATYVNRLTFRFTLAPQSSTRINAQASVYKEGSVTVGPVLVKSNTTPGSGQDRTFQRWEHCTTPINTVATFNTD